MLGLGILFILLGMVGLGMTFALTLASALAFGVLLILSGAFQIFDAFGRAGWKGIVWHALIGLIYLAAGLSTVSNPVAASALFTALLAGMFIAVGSFRIVLAWTNREHAGWTWMLFAGIGALLLGGLLLAHWPVSGLFAIGLFIALELLLQGWTLVILSLAARRCAGV